MAGGNLLYRRTCIGRARLPWIRPLKPFLVPDVPGGFASCRRAAAPHYKRRASWTAQRPGRLSGKLISTMPAPSLVGILKAFGSSVAATTAVPAMRNARATPRSLLFPVIVALLACSLALTSCGSSGSTMTAPSTLSKCAVTVDVPGTTLSVQRRCRDHQCADGA